MILRLRILNVATIVATTLPLLAASPASELTAALEDLQTNVTPAEWRSTRYLSFYNVPPDDRPPFGVVASFVLNSVSRQARLVAPQAVHHEDGALLRVNLDELRIPADAWESLISDREPYWHITTEVLDPRTKKRSTVYTDGGWLDLELARRLRDATQSGGAVVRADWFIAKATSPPHYYRLAGIGATLDEWHSLVGVDKKAILALRANRGANLFASGVTRKPRRISRWQGPAGGVWQTYDTFGDDPGKDPFRDPTFAARYDASEHIAAKPNGLHWFTLFDAQGKRQDSVPDRLAKDDSDPHGDGVLVPMLSCVRCHVEDGLRPFVDDQRRLAAGNVGLFATNSDTADLLSAFYDAVRLEQQATRDREDYAAAVAEVTGGMTTKQLASALTDVYRGFQNDLVDSATAKRELGVDDLAPLSTSHDPILLALVAGIRVQRQQWEASFAEAALLVASHSRAARRHVAAPTR